MPTTITCFPTLFPTWQTLSVLPSTFENLTIFRLPVSADTLLPERWHALLQPAEQQRAARFRQVADRTRFVLGRGLFRLVGGQLCNLPPERVTIKQTSEGKPFLADAPQWGLSVAHSGEWVLLAVAPQPVGVDVEWINHRFQVNDLVPITFTPAEQAAFCKSENAHAYFYELWTRKEALIKATGIGMTDDFGAIPVLEGTYNVDGRLFGASGSWMVQPFWVEQTYPAALATMATGEIGDIAFREVRLAGLI
jgi:4'-phosphopantetheinyl transferase